MELFDERVVLFQSDEGGEHLLVTCEPSGMGGLVVRQTSEGPLTQWCYEESPHVAETFVAHEALVALEHFYGVGTSNQVARMLSISFADYDCAQPVSYTHLDVYKRQDLNLRRSERQENAERF